MEKREKHHLEFKVEVNGTLLKAESAIANYDDGKIVFGIDDGGIVRGTSTPELDRFELRRLLPEGVSDEE